MLASLWLRMVLVAASFGVPFGVKSSSCTEGDGGACKNPKAKEGQIHLQTKRLQTVKPDEKHSEETTTTTTTTGFLAQYPYKGYQTSTLDMYPPFLVGATWGVSNCMGLANTSTDVTIDIGCPTVLTDTDNDCVGDTNMINRVVNQQTMQLMVAGNGQGQIEQYPLSALAVKFSWQIDQNTLDWSDFEFTMSDGSKIQPWGINVAPDADPEEAFTVTTYGYFGNATWGFNNDWTTGEYVDGYYPTRLTIIDELNLTNGTHTYNVHGTYFDGGNLDYTKGGVLTTAYVRAWANANDNSYGVDNCSVFPDTTYVLTAQTMGGTTYDGVNSFNPGRTELFTVKMKDGSELRGEAFEGLADLDGDDFTDICLSITDEEYENMAELNMNCNPDIPCQFWALPHGNAQGFAPCTETQPQVIAKPICPGSVVCR